MGLRVFERLSVRKYQGSYEAVAEAISLVSNEPTADLNAFFAQLVLCVNIDCFMSRPCLLYRLAVRVRGC